MRPVRHHKQWVIISVKDTLDSLLWGLDLWLCHNWTVSLLRWPLCEKLTFMLPPKKYLALYSNAMTAAEFWCFSLFYIIINSIFLGFWLLVGQNKLSKVIALGFWWLFFTIFWHFIAEHFTEQVFRGHFKPNIDSGGTVKEGEIDAWSDLKWEGSSWWYLNPRATGAPLIAVK